MARPWVKKCGSLAHLPNAVIGTVQVGLAVPQQVLLQIPRVRVLLPVGVSEGGKSDHHLPDDVGLVLVGGTIADAHWPRIRVATQVVGLELVQATLTGQAIHDLDLVGVARHGPQQPVPPQRRTAGEAVGEHHLQGEGGVA